MRQAIVTKYLGPTNFRGARIRVKAQAGSITVPWDHALDVAENHEIAARAFAEKWGWLKYGKMHGGALPDDTGYCFVLVSK